ncbi:AraC family transcriptional regulator [Streptomyces johnsoniae]|uniref:Helix-turn-helix transcriptional regulator n=1 Tax=Streptomyces johnsoniae TaxID=3075532 RepID=A0ABU2S0Z2_9ACTN|nr:helix-turn-helix transcriptional regulator [Streptomyces sp. DSM 41886]MDT0442674.1 helix-turn-helix transcriptional regulator [Streptomyces sp. DSM 41886]
MAESGESAESTMAVWRVPLGRPPDIARVDIGHHGTACTVEEWCLDDLWSLHLYGYHGRLAIGPHRVTLAPGWLSLIPPGTVHRFHYVGPSVHLFAHFHLPAAGAPTAALPSALDCGTELPRIRELFESARAASGTAPHRARADLWSLLCRLETMTAAADRDTRGMHPAVAAVLDHVDAHLDERMSVTFLARLAGISPNHLTRLFRTQVGETVVAHVRHRRLARARTLLTSTGMPVKTVAHSVGFGDLQTFNKAFRRRYGMSPRRARHGTMTAAPRPDDRTIG